MRVEPGLARGYGDEPKVTRNQAVASMGDQVLDRRSFLGVLGLNGRSLRRRLTSWATPAWAAGGPLLNFVAHQDDDLRFLSPDLLDAVQGGQAVRSVFVTAGDAGAGQLLAEPAARARAAYAKMAGVANTWKPERTPG